MEPRTPIRTPDQRLRVFVSSTLAELAAERQAVRRAIERLHLAPVLFELGARPHPPQELYRAYLAQSHVFVGLYWQRYGWVAPDDDVSGLEDEYRLSAGLPRLLYLKEPAPDREPRLQALLADVKADDRASYRRFTTPEELERLVVDDLSLLLSERFEAAGRPADAHAAPSARPPRPLTATVGRDADVAAAVARLREGVRLLTLTGPGGIGKSRLALEIAAAADGLFPDGVRFVPLADVTDPELVGVAVADRLGVRVEGTSRAVDALAAHLSSRRLLLVLDNLEQVITAGSELVVLLEHAPGLALLATSRRALRVRGEQELLVAPLAVPAAGAPASEVAASPSVQLLVERARAVGADIAVDAEAATLAELVRRLDGLPLAIEIAAARMRLLGPGALLARLAGHLDLATDRVDAPARHRTLRTTIDWSHALLDGRQRTLFARFSVFAGGATLDAVEAVCPGPDDDAGDIVDTLAALLDASLVAHDRDRGGGEPRLRMLETVRAYAAEALAARGEEAAVRARFLDHVVRLARRAQPSLCGPGQAAWAARLDPERANLRAAVAIALASDRVADALSLTWDTFVYYYVRDAFAEPRGWVHEIAARRDELGEVDRARLDVGLAIVTVGEDDRGGGVDLARAAEVLDVHGCVLELAVARFYLGLARWREGDADAALAALDASARGYAALDHDWGLATAETTAGTILTATGAPDDAVDHHRRALAHAREIDNGPLVLQAVLGIAIVDALEGRGDEAAEGLGDAIDLARREAWSSGAAFCAEAFAVGALAADRTDAGVRALASAAAMRARLGTPSWTASAPVIDALADRARRRLGEATFRRHWQEGAELVPLALLDAELAPPDGDPVATAVD